MWLRLFAAPELEDMDAGELLLKALFDASPTTECVLSMMPSKHIPAMVRHLFAVQVSNSDAATISALEDMQLFKCSRASMYPSVAIRPARVEDFDPLMEVFELQSHQIRERFGEFFLAEVIEAQNESNKAWVAEMDGRVLGLMSVTTDLGEEVFRQCFDLSSYDGFTRFTNTSEVRTKGTSVSRSLPKTRSYKWTKL